VKYDRLLLMAKAKAEVLETPEQKSYRETVEQIAGNIKNLAIAVDRLLNGPLKKRALVVLLASSSGQSQKTVDLVLQSLSNLHSDWLNK
jgi:hypothetical protein